MSAWMLHADYLEYIHDALVALLWPGTEPISERDYRDRRLLESAAARPFHTVLGEDAYPTILRKAAALFHSINANHRFMNGNKRTAVIALDHFLIARIITSPFQMMRCAKSPSIRPDIRSVVCLKIRVWER